MKKNLYPQPHGSGWTYCYAYGALYHFEHIPMKNAERTEDYTLHSIYVIETINWTISHDKKSVHKNKYFANDLTSALNLLVRIQSNAERNGIPEDVIGLRLATDEEFNNYSKVHGKLWEDVNDKLDFTLYDNEIDGLPETDI
jgi:hypothetical protein